MFGTLICAQYAHGMTIACTYTDANDIYKPTLATIYICKASIKNSSRDEVLEAVSGTHLGGKSNFDVDVFTIEGKKFKRLPQGLARFFPSIKGLRFQDTSLSTLTAEDLKPFPNLVYLRSRDNNLRTLDGELFKFNPKMEYIDFESCSIEHVGYDLLTNLTALKYANFLTNICINVRANTAQEIPKLRLQLQGCPPLSTTTMFTTVITATTPYPLYEEKIQVEHPDHNDKLLRELLELQKHQTEALENIIRNNVIHASKYSQMEREVKLLRDENAALKEKLQKYSDQNCQF